MTPLLYSTFSVNLPLQPTAPGMPVSSLFSLLLLHHSSSLPTTKGCSRHVPTSCSWNIVISGWWIFSQLVPQSHHSSGPGPYPTSWVPPTSPWIVQIPLWIILFLKKQKECDSMIPSLKSLVWLSIACKVNSSLSGTLPHSLSLTSLSISSEKNFCNSESLDVRFLPSRIFFHLFSSRKLMFIPQSLAQLLAPLWGLSQIPVLYCNSTCHIWVTCLHVWLHKIELLNVDHLSYFCVTLFPTQTNGATDNHVTHLTVSSFPPM